MAAGNAFEPAAGKATVHGTYTWMMSIPERPVPPIAVDGTLTVEGRHQCAVMQIAYNGPADGIEWRTIGSRCRSARPASRRGRSSCGAASSRSCACARTSR